MGVERTVQWSDEAMERVGPDQTIRKWGCAKGRNSVRDRQMPPSFPPLRRIRSSDRLIV